MSEYTLSYWEPYITGKKNTGEAPPATPLEPATLQKFIDCVTGDPVAKQVFNNCLNAAEFYDIVVDFKYLIPKDQRKEVFYAAKYGKYCPQVPSFCTFLLSRAWQQCQGIPNLVVKSLTKGMLSNFCTVGYFSNGVTLQDVICNVCHEEYVPLSEVTPRNKTKEFTELYVRATDMVAAVPHAIADQLSDTDVLDITVTPHGLSCKGMLLRTMAGHYGITNSVYDLRDVI